MSEIVFDLGKIEFVALEMMVKFLGDSETRGASKALYRALGAQLKQEMRRRRERGSVPASHEVRIPFEKASDDALQEMHGLLQQGTDFFFQGGMEFASSFYFLLGLEVKNVLEMPNVPEHLLN